MRQIEQHERTATHAREDLRLSYLKSLELLDKPSDKRFDQIVYLVKEIMAVEIATITLVDEDRQWFLAREGLPNVCQTDREISFCTHTILEDEFLMIEDTLKDARFSDNPFVTDYPNIRSYLGIIIWGASGNLPIGSLCAIDTKPTKWTSKDLRIMKSLAGLVESHMHANVHEEIERNKSLLESNIDVSLNCLDYKGLSSILNNEINNNNQFDLFDNLVVIRLEKNNSIQFKHGKNAVDKILLGIIELIYTNNPGLNMIIGRFDTQTLGFLFYDSYPDEVSDLLNSTISKSKIPVSMGNIEINSEIRSIHIHDISVFEDFEDLEYTVRNVFRHSSLKRIYYDSSHDLNEIKRKSTIRKRMRTAIDNNELEMFYQPKVAINTKTIEGFEALIRWRDEELGFVSPIDILESVDVLNLEFKFISWTINQVMKDINAWLEDGNNALPVSINLTGSVLLLPELCELTEKLIEIHKLNPALIEFEILESSILENIQTVTTNIQRLKKLGLKISIDDFGTGYSALRLLSQLPIDRVKIDKSFIDHLCDDHKTTDIVNAIINISHSYGYDLVAEGVETRDQLLVLRALGCEYAQGYFFSKPLPMREIPELLETPSYSHVN